MSDEYKPVTMFGIDDGELDGLTSQQCFVLGYELCLVAGSLGQTSPGESCHAIHPENLDRIRVVAGMCHRRTTIRAYDDNWFELTIHPKEPHP